MKTRSKPKDKDIDHVTAPGIEHDDILHYPGGSAQTTVTCIDYSPTNMTVQEIGDLDEFVAVHRSEWSVVRWISVVGLSNMNVIHPQHSG